MLINVPKDIGKAQNVPAGIYRAIVSGHKTRVSANSGNLVLNVEFTIQSQGPDETQKTVGRKVFDSWTMTENALGIINTKFKALTGSDLPAGEMTVDAFVAMITSAVTNKEALIEVVIDTGQDGVERNNIKRVTKLS
jgi:hypothetical protein